jgi:tetratricopeptide (TPR) repeat protein
VHLAAVPAPGTGKPSHAALAELIGPVAPGTPIVRAVGDALRAAARARPIAVILDDLHVADHDLFDALEYATLGGERLPLWVLGVAASRLESKRPQLGARAERHRRDVLPPLEEDAAIALAAKLLEPAEYPPLRALSKLAAIAHGNPLHLSMLAREIHERGAIRARPGGAAMLDTTALDDLPPAALGPWLAARELGPLSAELVSLARLCAVLGGEFARAELGAMVEAVEKYGGATTTIDVDVGLAELKRAGILAKSAHGFRFREALVEEGIYGTTNEAERLALHQAALAAGGSPEHISRHAEATGAHAAAASAYAELGERAQREHRTLDADEAWSGALRHLEAPDAARARALVGRATARYKLQRVRDALADLEEALAIAVGAADAALETRVLLELATALDWGEDFTRSAEIAERARARAGDAGDAALDLDVALAIGRTHFRKQEFAEAAHTLRDVVSRARAAGRGEVETVAGLLLGPSLVAAHDLDAAERAFEELIAHCEHTHDRAHLGFAFTNRAWLWEARGQVDRSARDLREVIQLARELGQAVVERIGTHNLAESLLWAGELDESLRLSARCLAIQEAHAEGSTAPDRLLLARVHVARGDRDDGRRLVSAFEATAAIENEDQLVVAALRCALDDDASGWPRVLGALDLAFPQLRVELAHLAARAGQLVEPTRTDIIELARKDPTWSRRVHEL